MWNKKTKKIKNKIFIEEKPLSFNIASIDKVQNSLMFLTLFLKGKQLEIGKVLLPMKDEVFCFSA